MLSFQNHEYSYAFSFFNCLPSETAVWYDVFVCMLPSTTLVSVTTLKVSTQHNLVREGLYNYTPIVLVCDMPLCLLYYSRLYLGFHWSGFPETPYPFPTNDASLVAISQYLRLLYLKSNAPDRILASIEGSSWNSYLSLHAHALQTTQVWIRWIDN
jgi:hypothetical protein